MKNKHGDGYIMVCVTVVILCMLLSVFVSFASAVNIVRQTERNSRVVLDNFVMQNAIDIYDSIKEGTDTIALIDEDEYISQFCSFNSLDLRGDNLYCCDEDGNEQYRLTKPVLTFITEEELKLQAEYTVIIPMYFAGLKFSEASVPITVVSRLDNKF